jgi:hypothetical protein
LQKKNEKKYMIAYKIWGILIYAASNRQTFTYSSLAEILEKEITCRNVGNYLGPIQSYCKMKKLPPLTVLVNRKDGLHGSGKFDGENTKRCCKDRERVFEFNWQQYTPTIDDFINS